MLSKTKLQKIQKFILIKPNTYDRVCTTNKVKIMKLFRKKIKNKDVIIDGKKHCGSIGHWLEGNLGVKRNASNEPDLFGYEIKKSANKITFGDFSASEYLFSHKRDELNKINGYDFGKLNKKEFIRIFGTYKSDKKRFSWSGKSVPKYPNKKCTNKGLKFIVEKGDIICYYYPKLDKNVNDILFKKYRLFEKDKIAIAIWKESKMRKHIENKFNQKGFVIFNYDNKIGRFTKLYFGKPLSYELFIDEFTSGNIFFDSGMYEGNNRNYSQFRASMNFWKELIYAEFE